MEGKVKAFVNGQPVTSHKTTCGKRIKKMERLIGGTHSKIQMGYLSS